MEKAWFNSYVVHFSETLHTHKETSTTNCYLHRKAHTHAHTHAVSIPPCYQWLERHAKQMQFVK